MPRQARQGLPTSKDSIVFESMSAMLSPCAEVLLSIKCSHLKNMDTFSKSDPCVFVSMKEPRTQYSRIGHTEAIQDNLNPQFVDSIRASYYFEKQQLLKFEVYDLDTAPGDVPSSGDDLIGILECRLGAICGARNQTFTQELTPAKRGTITISMEEIAAKSVSNVRVGAEFNERLLMSSLDDMEGEGEMAELLKDTPTDLANLQRIAELQSQELPSATETIPYVRVSFRGERLKKMDLFGKSDPYYVLSRTMRSGGEELQRIHRSEKIMKNLNPVWQVAEIEVAELGGMDRRLQIDVWDWDRLTSDDLIGSVEITMADLVGATESDPRRMELKLLRNPRKKNRGFLLCVGCVEFHKNVINRSKEAAIQQQKREIANLVKRVEDSRKKRKVDYVRSQRVAHEARLKRECMGRFVNILRRIEISLHVAVDFTGSNGNPSSASSLHYTGGSKPNQYQEAMEAIGNILQDYDSDKMFPVYGFGGRYKGGGVSHCFPLNGNDEDAECDGVGGMMAAYQTAIFQYPLSGGTEFHHVIDHVVNDIKEDYNPQGYNILLILSDGEIDDMTATKRSIIRASELPLSIIIVGVGRCSFSQMEVLDSDDSLLTVGGSVAKADIVQFVPFRDFAHDGVALSEATLCEIPMQVVSFYDRLERGL